MSEMAPPPDPTTTTGTWGCLRLPAFTSTRPKDSSLSDESPSRSVDSRDATDRLGREAKRNRA